MVIIFIAANICHQDKISLLLTEELFTDKIFQYCYGTRKITKNYFYSLLFLMHLGSFYLGSLLGLFFED